jgi:hypothetical protein
LHAELLAQATGLPAGLHTNVDYQQYIAARSQSPNH